MFARRIALLVARRPRRPLACLAAPQQRFQSTDPPLQPSYFHHIGRHPLVHRTVGQQLARAARLYPERECVVACEQRQRLTFAAALERADRVAAGLLRLGLRPGDRLGIWAPNSAHWYVTMMGAARAGLVSVALNPAYQPPEIAYCLRKVGVRAIYAAHTHRTQDYHQLLCAAVPELSGAGAGGGADDPWPLVRSPQFPDLQRVIIDSPDALPGAMRFADLLALPTDAEVSAIDARQPLIPCDAPCNIQFTSGTTGQPKAAVLSHHAFVNNGIHIAQRSELAAAAHRICVQVPLFHAFGVVIACMAALAHGTTLVLPAAGYSPDASLRAIAAERCSVIYGTPTMYVDLVARQRALRADVSSAQLATTGGAPCSPQLFGEIRAVLGLREVKTVFGLTETAASAFFSMAGETEEQVTQTVGHVQEHLEAKVVDAGGRTVPMGEAGELLVRGYATMLGYWGDEERTRETIGADRWLRTGDQFVLQPDGYGRIVGRLKDVIIRGGENIYPKEIEDFLNAMEGVLECHVYGVPDERLGEEVAVDVRMEDEPTTRMGRERIAEYCRGRLAHYKVPKYVRVVDGFPKTASGKVQKYKLRDQFVADAAAAKGQRPIGE